MLEQPGSKVRVQCEKEGQRSSICRDCICDILLYLAIQVVSARGGSADDSPSSIMPSTQQVGVLVRLGGKRVNRAKLMQQDVDAMTAQIQ